MNQDLRSRAIHRSVSQIRGNSLYSIGYKIPSQFDDRKRELRVFFKLHSEFLTETALKKFSMQVGNKLIPTEAFEIYQMLALKAGGEDENLTFLRSENDSDLLELLMSSEMMIKISKVIPNVCIDNVLMITDGGMKVSGAPGTDIVTSIGIGLIL